MRYSRFVVPAIIAAASVFAFTACGDDPPDPPTPEIFAELAAIELGGYTRESGTSDDVSSTATYVSQGTTGAGANLRIRIDFDSCEADECPSIDASDYEDEEVQQELIAESLPPEHAENPNLKWEFGEVELASGLAGLFHRGVSFIEEEGSDGSDGVNALSEYVSWYHDEALLVTMTITPAGGLFDDVDSFETLDKLVTLVESFVASGTAFARYLNYYED